MGGLALREVLRLTLDYSSGYTNLLLVIVKTYGGYKIELEVIICTEALLPLRQLRVSRDS